MRIHQQNAELRKGLNEVAEDMKSFKAAILRKMNAMYPDGSRDNQVNASTDVLPRIDQALTFLDDLLYRVS